MNLATIHQPEAPRVLTRALLRMCTHYNLSARELAEILGVSEASTTRMHQGKKWINPDSKEGEIALLLLRVYRSLNALVGNHNEKAQSWLRAPNHYLRTIPVNALKTVTGLVEVVRYLDALRGKL